MFANTLIYSRFCDVKNGMSHVTEIAGKAENISQITLTVLTAVKEASHHTVAKWNH